MIALPTSANRTRDNSPMFTSDFSHFLKLVGLQNATQYRQKKLSIQNLIKMVEEVYSFRHT